MKTNRYLEKPWLVVLFGAVFMVWLVPVQCFAHHPAADIVDEEIYELINEMVEDTPHAEIEFDDAMGDGNDTTTVTIDTVSAAEDLIDEGLLADVSLLDGDVTVTIEFPDDSEAGNLESPLYSLNGKAKKGNHKKWSEWGGPVVITIEHIYEVGY